MRIKVFINHHVKYINNLLPLSSLLFCIEIYYSTYLLVAGARDFVHVVHWSSERSKSKKCVQQSIVHW